MLAQHYLMDTLATMRKLKEQAERAMAQVTDEQFFALIDSESNSIALIVKHVAGNMRSRWTDFLTSDGEKANRNRDREFEADTNESRRSVTDAWQSGWTLTLGTLESLMAADLERTVYIRGEAMTAMQAIQRQLTHYAGHVGQIVLLAKHYAGADWRTLSIPKRKPAG